MNKSVLFKLESGIATLTLNRPEKRNALNGELVIDLLEQLEKVNNNPQIHIVILQANGKDFCAGADIHWLIGPNNDQAVKLLTDLFYKLQQLNKPTIALIQGNVYGGGLGLVACCDIGIASSTAIFCFPEVKLGLIPAIIAPYCIAAIGRRAAQHYFLTAEIFDSKEAYRISLIQRIVEEDNLLADGLLLAKKILDNKPEAVGLAKSLILKYNWNFL